MVLSHEFVKDLSHTKAEHWSITQLFHPVEANHVSFVGIRVQSFTRHSLCTKHNFSKEKHLQLINWGSGEGRTALTDGGSLGGNSRGYAPPHPKKLFKALLPREGGGTRKSLPLFLLAVTWLPLRAGSRKAVQMAGPWVTWLRFRGSHWAPT